MDIPAVAALNRSMPRCNACNGIITRVDVDCYVCGEPIPGRSKFSLFRFLTKPKLAATRAPLRMTMMDSKTDGKTNES
jgi:hypothetical protein